MKVNFNFKQRHNPITEKLLRISFSRGGAITFVEGDIVKANECEKGVMPSA